MKCAFITSQRRARRSSVWANVVAILSVAGTIGALYLPLVVH
jgi:hypothetical protein